MYEFQQGEIVGALFKVKKLLSQGSFGKVYIGKNIETGMKVAIKVEKQQMSEYLSLEREVEILKKLRGIPQTQQMLWFGNHNGLKVMVNKMLGFDLIYFLRKHKKFSHECVFSVARQMIEILENIHKKNIIHRDLKPENILAKSHSDKIFLIDFGISKDIIRNKNRQKAKVPFIGTSRYASLAAHQGYEQSKRDDLESLGYVLIYLLKQKLPWMNYERGENNRLERIAQMKQELTLEELCNGCPPQLLNYMRHVRTITSQMLPNYTQLKQIFKQKDVNMNCVFDWYNPKFKISKSSQEDRIKIKQKQSYDSACHIQLSFDKSFQRNLKTIAGANESRISSSFISASFESVVQSFGSQQSVLVDFVNSDSSSPSQKKPNKISTFDGIQALDDIMPLKDQFQLMELENQDLEIKHNLLHFQSVYFNFKNPIQRYLQLKII